jgi:hypothetical protein
MTYVLRKSFGAHSAGTPVYEHEGEFQIGLYNDARDVPSELVVKRRNRIVMRPNTTTSRQRRKDNKHLALLLAMFTTIKRPGS